MSTAQVRGAKDAAGMLMSDVSTRLGRFIAHFGRGGYRGDLRQAITRLKVPEVTHVQ